MCSADLPERSKQILGRFLVVLLFICFNVRCANPASQADAIVLTLRAANYEDDLCN